MRKNAVSLVALALAVASFPALAAPYQARAGGPAERGASSGLPVAVQALCFLGAANVMRDNGGPDFAYGGGLRLLLNLNAKVGMALGAEYSHRGSYWEMSCIDFLATALVGRKFYSEAGFYGSVILSQDAEAHGWDGISGSDFGSVVGFGWRPPDGKGFSFALRCRVGIVDLTADSWYQGGGLYITNQQNIDWGALFIYGI